jgi:hypothetical protein
MPRLEPTLVLPLLLLLCEIFKHVLPTFGPVPPDLWSRLPGSGEEFSRCKEKPVPLYLEVLKLGLMVFELERLLLRSLDSG